MKKLLTLAAVLLAGVSAMAQGTVNFANGAPGVNAPIRDAAGAFCAGTAFVVQLWAGTSSGALVEVLPTANFGTGGTAGYFFGGERAVGFAGGTPGFFQVRAWSANFTSYAAALAAYTAGDITAQVGESNTFPLTPASPPAPGVPLVGLATFQLRQVPEPSTIALGLLGAAALLLRRRK